MRRRYKANAAQAAPPATDLASDGYPGEGDVSRGVPATIPGPYWYYVVTEQIVRTILASGVRAVDLTDDPDQFVTALKNLAKAQTPYADNAEALAGALTDKAINPATLKHVIDAVIGGAPGALDTLNELAAALNDDADFHATITNALALKAPLASPEFTGNPTAPTQAEGNNSTRLATTAFVKHAADGVKDVVLASDIDLVEATRSTHLLAESLDGFRWIEILGGSGPNDFAYRAKVQRPRITALEVSSGFGVFLLTQGSSVQVQHRLYSVDKATGAMAAIGPMMDFGSHRGLYTGAGMTKHGEATYVGFVDPDDKFGLYRLDTTTGVITAAGDLQTLPSLSGGGGASLVSDGTTMYLLVLNDSGNWIRLYSVNPSTAALTAIGGNKSVGSGDSEGLGAAFLGGTLYALTRIDSSRTQLYSVNVSSGALTTIGGKRNTPSGFVGSVGMVGSGGVLYAASVIWNSDDFQLFTVNTANGVVTAQGVQQSTPGGSQYWSGNGLSELYTVTGGLEVPGLRIDRHANATIGLTAAKALRIHEVIGVM